MDMAETPLVSIIMNCYNGEKYLREALDSVMAQTYQNWELIFWDNQSTEKSAEIFNSLMIIDLNILLRRIIHYFMRREITPLRKRPENFMLSWM